MYNYKFEGTFYILCKYVLDLYIQVNTYSIKKYYRNMTYHFGMVRLLLYCRVYFILITYSTIRTGNI